MPRWLPGCKLLIQAPHSLVDVQNKGRGTSFTTRPPTRTTHFCTGASSASGHFQRSARHVGL
eukprot:3835466-Pyramimonas_sp.AAC.1